MSDGSDLLHLHLNFDGGVAQLRAAGELDIHTSRRLLATIEQLCTRELDIIAVDGAELSFVDSAGLRALMLARDRADLLGIRLQLVHLSDELDKVLAMTGLHEELCSAEL